MVQVSSTEDHQKMVHARKHARTRERSCNVSECAVCTRVFSQSSTRTRTCMYHILLLSLFKVHSVYECTVHNNSLLNKLIHEAFILPEP